MHKKNTASLSGIFLSAFIVFVLATIGMTGYLHLSQNELGYQAEAAIDPLLYIPPFAMEYIADGGVTSTLTIVALNVAHSIVFAAAFIFVGKLVGNVYFSSKTKKSIPKKKHYTESQEYLTQSDKRAEIVLMPKRGEVMEDVFNEIYLRIKRSALQEPKELTTPLERFEWALIEILHAHKDWSVDPDGHHGTTGLLDHSKNVALRLRELLPNEPLATAIGLSHDIGKILAYAPAAGQPVAVTSKWRKKIKHHDTMSSLIVRMIPEFKALPDEQKLTLSMVLEYCHNPKILPKGTSAKTVKLINTLRDADGLSTHREQKKVGDITDDPVVIEEVKDKFFAILSSLNVNNYKEDGVFEGWTQSVKPYIAINADKMRLAMDGYISPEVATKLQVRVDWPNIDEHPAVRVLLKAAEELGVLIISQQGYMPKSKLFRLRSGRFTFKDIMLLDRGPFERDNPDQMDLWGECEHKIKVMTSDEKPNSDKKGKAA